MKNYFLKTLFLLLLVMQVQACSDNDKDRADESFTVLDFYQEYLRFEHPDCTINNQPCVTMVFNFPEFKPSGNITDSLRHWIDENMFYFDERMRKISFQELANHWFADYDEFFESIDGYNLAWELDRSAEMIYENEWVASLQFYEYSYTGGAHPTTFERFQSFHKADGRSITFNMIVESAGQANQLFMIGEELFREFHAIDDESDLNEAGFWFDDGIFYLPDNFAFTDNGLLFFFNNYEIAPYAVGPTAIEIPYNRLTGILKPEYLDVQNGYANR